MKRIYLVCLLLACLITAGYAQEKYDITNQSVSNPNQLRRLLVNRFSLVEDDIAAIEALQSKGRGEFFYVYSVTGSNSYTGTDIDHPLATLDAAIGKCTANRGDVIFVLQNHAETMAGADAVDIDIAGVTVIGLGSGDDRPTFTFDTTTDEFVLGRSGDNATIYNLCFLPGVSEVVHGVDVEDGADNVAILNCEFLESVTAAYEFDKMITVAVEANDLTIQGCKFTSNDAAGATDAIEIGDGVAVRPVIVDNWFNGQFASGAIFSDQACTDATMSGNTVIQNATGVAAVSLTGAWTGVAEYNRFYSDTWGTLGVTVFDPGSLKCFENYGATAVDKAASVIPSASLGQDMYQWINGADGMSTWLAGAKPTNGVSLAEGLRYLVELLANGTPATITAPGTNLTILDIIGGNGSTTTGATASSILGHLGTNEAAADTPFTSSTVESDRDGSILERLEFLIKYFETGTPGALVAPASTRSILDILGSDGTTTTGALAGSILGAIGTDEASASTAFASTSVQDDGDGSVLERLEHVQADTDKLDAVTISTTPVAASLATFIASGGTSLGTQLAASKSLVDAIGTNGTTVADTATGIAGMIGVNDNDNAMDTSTVASNRDGSVFERLEFLIKYFETGTPGALVAPASTFSLLDILGSDGSTTTGAVAGSILGAIGTNEAIGNTPFTSATVASDEDGSVLERQEYGQTMMEKTISKTLSTIANGNNNLFVVAGGPIRLVEIVTYVTTTPIAAEGCLINYNIDPTTPATDTVFGTDGTAVECNNAAVGTVLTWNGTVGADLLLQANGVAVGAAASSGLIIPIGSIELAAVHDGTCAGEVTVYMRYLPLSASSVVTAAP